MLKQKYLGVTLIILSVIVTINLFVLSKENFTFFWVRPLLGLSQLVSLIGTVLLCLSFVTSSKALFLESWFGGLDRVFKVHRILGGSSFVLLLIHPMLLAVNYLPSKKLAFSIMFPGENWINNFGIFALWLLIFLLMITIYIKLPYSLWKKLHTCIGLVLLFGALHIFLVKSDVSRFLPLKLWMMFIIFSAFYSYVYVKFLYYRIGPKYHYIVDGFNRISDVLEIYLKPISESLKFKPGQFVFLQFENQKEPDLHPFSISSDPLSDSIRFSIKIVGDFTLSLRELRKGTGVKLWGPYGKFSEQFFQNKSAICIAGGIGVTPFLGMLSLEVRKKIADRDIFFFYCGKNQDELCYHDEIANMSQMCSSIKYISHFSGDKGRINARQVLEVVGNFKNKLIFLCGPILMMQDLEKQFSKLGVNKNDIIFEDFSLK